MSGIYIHVPFCHSKCYYCDFYSSARNDVFRQYTDALLSELKARRSPQEDYRTLYLGGGTPSVLPIEELKRIFDELSSEQFEEATIEVNPEDVDQNLLDMLKNSPITRISMGVQSAIDSELRKIGRRHTAAQAIKAAELIKNDGFILSLDLIYGLPEQTLTTWEKSLNEILKLEPEHLSCYLLSYEEGTRLYKLRKEGSIMEATDTEATGYYQFLCETMKIRGYEHYEISNFAKKNFRAKHNANYWNFTPYLGLGPGAHSFDGNQRSFNPCSIKDYISRKGKNFNVIEKSHPNDRINDYIMIRLRTSDGLNMADFTKRFGEEAQRELNSKMKRFVESDEIEVMGDRFRIREEKWLVSDSIICELLADN